ncbi:hypothetical protein DVH05_026097 [Phytophthora capsici]|nr:hypothetical protein DVH05_026097 [Phytophthora capsici]
MCDEDDGINDLLLLFDAYSRRESSLRSARRDVHQLKMESVWRAAMRTRHYVTARCLDAP